MKKRLLVSVIASAIAISATAQTNTFPASGNVGIGTTNPISKLHVKDGSICVSDINYNNINMRMAVSDHLPSSFAHSR